MTNPPGQTTSGSSPCGSDLPELELDAEFASDLAAFEEALIRGCRPDLSRARPRSQQRVFEEACQLLRVLKRVRVPGRNRPADR